MILGIDEVGRGPWAGPLVIGAVVLPDIHTIEGLNDSKKLSAKRRLELNGMIREQALGFGLGWIEPAELDEMGMTAALKLATIRAVEQIKTPYHEIIIDGTINFLSDTNKSDFVTTLAKADGLIPAVSAASIIAKVARDAYMVDQARMYPEYGFEKHVGYGTAQHSAALQKYGVTPLHRTSFAPIAKLMAQEQLSVRKEKTANTGAKAENSTAQFLEKNGYQVVERNWKTKWCEIDIIAEKNTTRYFVEVKYRSSMAQGGALAALTPQKVAQMQFAAELYNGTHPYTGNSQLIGAVVDPAGSIVLLDLS